MRAKSIKNKARVNAELSPAELKALLKKSQRDVGNSRAYVGLLEQEVNLWRAGGTVDRESWATMEKALGLGVGELDRLAGPPSSSSLAKNGSTGVGSTRAPTPTTPGSRSFTPLPNHLLDKAGASDSRPLTPSGSTLDKDEKDEFLRRENELGDQLAKTVRRFSSLESS